MQAFRLVEAQLGSSKGAAAAFLMALTVALPPLLLEGGLKRRPAGSEPDWLLFGGPLANAAFFTHNALLGAGKDIIPPPLKLLVVAVSAVSLVCHAIACGLIGCPTTHDNENDAPAAAAAARGRASGARRGGAPATSKSPAPRRRRAAAAAAAATTAGGATAAALLPALAGLPAPSALDVLQKDAQANELDPSNTAPRTFLLLAAVQVPVCYALAVHAFAVPAWLALAPLASHAAMFFVSHYVLHTDKLFDITGEVTFFPLILASHAAIAAPAATPRQQLGTALALLWCARLGLFLGWRIFNRGSDWRFEKLMSEPCYNLFGWVSQGTWIFLQGAALWLLHHRPALAGSLPVNASGNGVAPELLQPLAATDLLGALVFLVGLAVEHTADMQKTAWNAATPSGQQKTWLAAGLWKYSRHPNFFGEGLLWWGICLVACGALAGADCALAAVSPVWSTFFLFFTSLMLLEKRLDAKFGGRDDYERYKRRTSVLLLWPPLADDEKKSQ